MSSCSIVQHRFETGQIGLCKGRTNAIGEAISQSKNPKDSLPFDEGMFNIAKAKAVVLIIEIKFVCRVTARYPACRLWFIRKIGIPDIVAVLTGKGWGKREYPSGYFSGSQSNE